MKNNALATRFFHLGNGIIRAFFYSLITIAIFAALGSSNWVPDAGNTTGLTYFLLLAVIAFWSAWLLSPRFKKFLRFIFVKNKWRTSLILLIIAIIWQLQFVYCTHPAIGFDVSAVRNGLLHPESPELRGYFSVNYNNLPLLITLHQVTKMLHSTSWLTLGLASAVVTDLSALAIIGTVAVIEKKQLPAAFYVSG
jgi:hypothetical protein